MEDLLYQYNPWWEGDYNLENVIMRDNYIHFLKAHFETRHIVFLTGLRRVGKTTLLKLLIKYLLSIGVESQKILYFSVDDYLLKGKSLLDILDEYRKIQKLKVEEKFYVFFDEITYISNYHQQLKNIYDKYDLKIYATSSSSSLLRDKQAYLTGRSVTLEIKPLDFEEYKIFKGINLKKSDDKLNEAYFREYIKVGGLPENVLNPNREYLMNLVEDIIQKDITAFHSLKDSQLVRDYFTLLMERSGKQLSINKISNILKISPDTSRRYLGFFEETYLIHLVSRWGRTNEKILSAKKIYACDLGIKHLFVGERDFGSYFENYIYLNLRNRKEIYYLYEDGNEIDFYTSDKIMIESKYNSEMNLKQKELFDSYKANKKLIVDSVRNLKLLEKI